MNVMRSQKYIKYIRCFIRCSRFRVFVNGSTHAYMYKYMYLLCTVACAFLPRFCFVARSNETRICFVVFFIHDSNVEILASFYGHFGHSDTFATVNALYLCHDCDMMIVILLD